MLVDVLHAIFVMLLNEHYGPLALRLTLQEAYATHEDRVSSLAQKRVFFEFVNCFASLFFIAFYLLDLTMLRNELVWLFLVDELRRMLYESVLPYLWSRPFGHHHHHSPHCRESAASRRKKALAHSSSIVEVEEETLPPVDLFEDYLEMVMQFGYVTLFAAAFPLAAALSIVANLVEIRSDAFKMAFLLGRAQPVGAEGIGPWLAMLKIFAILSAVSNALLFGFTSNQMKVFFPELFEDDGTITLGEGRFVVAVVFVLEHLALLAVFYLMWRIPSQRVRRE